MVKSELISKISIRFPDLRRDDIKIAVDQILIAISESIISENRVEIRGFGVFKLNHRPPRTGRNPMTGTAVVIPSKHTPHFKPGKDLREKINRSSRIANRI